MTGGIYMIGAGLDQYLANIKDRLPAEINYNYVYDLFDDTDVPSDTGESVYKKVFKINNMDYVADVPFIGLESPSEFFPVNTDNLTVTSSSAAHWPPAAFLKDFLLIYVLSAGFTLNQIKKIDELDYVRANE